MYEDLSRDLRDPNKPIDCNEVADAIEELIRRAAEWEVVAESWQKACKGLESRMPRWIPVEERLPKYGDWVLGIGPKRGYHVCEYRGITHFPYSGDSPWFSAKGRTLTITHWMPLPDPPKEETE